MIISAQGINETDHPVVLGLQVLDRDPGACSASAWGTWAWASVLTIEVVLRRRLATLSTPPALFDGVRAPSTLGSFLRAFSWGNVCQLEAVNRRLLAELASRTPVLADGEELTWLDIDSCQRRVYGHAKQGVGFGHAKVGGYQVRLRGLTR